ncbi:MAG: hypothetical protein IJB52_00490 [Clostridia bacterium]|nr:hypothetical protein [Clostridia bacterium]
MSIQLYPVQKSDFSHDGYTVKINGQSVPTDAARVSAMPYNRRWPGHQRTLDQTECISFLSLAADEPLSFEITPKDPFTSVVIRPHSLGIEPEITDDGRILFTLPHPAYCTVEPYSRRNALHIFADPMGEYDVDPDDPHTIWYGPGIHEAGQIDLHSGDTLYLAEGAVVYACITAMDAENIRILGRGILDNSHNKAVILYESNTENNDSAVNNATRQHTVQLEYCTNVEIDGITIRDSLVYNIRPIGCRGLTIRNVKIIGCWRFNSDGIDMHNCEDVLIEHCFLRTFDDSICVKGFDCYYEGDVEAAVQAAMYRNGQAYDVFRNVLVRDCVIWNDWGKCLEIGAETRAEEICSIVFEDCDVIHVCGPVLDCCNVDYADVHDVTFRRIRVEMDEVIPPPRYQYLDREPYGEVTPGYVPQVVRSDVLFHHEYSAGGSRRGKNRNLLFEDIHICGDVCPAFGFSGYSDDFGCSDIVIRNVYVNGKLAVEPSEYSLHIGEHCRNIRYEHDE